MLSLKQQGLPTETTEEGIQMLDAGNVGGVVSSIRDASDAYNQIRNQGQTATQRERNEALRVAQDPNSTELEKNSALRFLGDKPRATISAQERIATNANLGGAVVNQKAAESGAVELAKIRSKT